MKYMQLFLMVNCLIMLNQHASVWTVFLKVLQLDSDYVQTRDKRFRTQSEVE